MSTINVSVKLRTGTVVVLAGREADQMLILLHSALTPEPEDIATVITYLGERVVAYQLDQGPWRALTCFEVPTHISTSREKTQCP